MDKEILRLDNVTVQFDGITYLKNLNLWIKESEIVGLINIEQQGIEQLIELIVDNHPIQYGKIFLNDVLINDSIQMKAQTNEIYVIDQQLRLIPDLTVADNIFVLRKGFRKWVINTETLETEVQKVLKELEIPIEPNVLVKDLKPFERCVIEFIKAVLSGSKLVIIQHISEMINLNELRSFYELMKYYKKKGMSFLYIGHHHEDVFQIAERVLIYEHGEIIKVLHENQMNLEHLAPYIDKIGEHKKSNNRGSTPILELQNIKLKGMDARNICLRVGECTTIIDQGYGLALQAIDIYAKGKGAFVGDMIYKGKAIGRKEALQLQDKVLIIPEDPVNRFLFLDHSFMYNLAFLADKKLNKTLMPSRVLESIKKEWGGVFHQYMEAVQIADMPLKELYSLVYYKVILYRPEIVYLIQPFAGADMHLRIHISELIVKLKEENIAIALLTNHVADVRAVTDEFILLEEENQRNPPYF